MTEIDFLNSLDRVSRAMNKARDVDHVIEDVLGAVFSIFKCDRVWLFYPCDPNAQTFKVLAEKNKPEYPGAFAAGQELPITPDAAETIKKAIESGSPIVFDPESGNKIDDIAVRFSVLSQMLIAVHPKTGKPWMFGMHQCAYARVWTRYEQQLFKEISFRVVEGLSNLILLRDLKRSELKYRRFFTTVKNGWAYHQTVTNAEGLPVDYIFLEVNKAFEKLTDLKSEHIVGQRATQVLSHDPETMSEWIDKFGQVSLSGESITFEGYFKATDVWYSVSVSRPEPGHFITVFENISKRKESSERLRTILDSINSMIYVADMETYELLFINKYGRDRWGDITGEICWQTLQAGQSGPCSFCTNDKLIDTNANPLGPYIWEFKNTVDNEWYECRDQAIRWLDGRIVRMEIASNITQRKEVEEQKRKLEEKLQQAMKMEAVGTLAGGIAHDFNNILGAIIGYTELARESSTQFPVIQHNLEGVLQAADRAKDLVKQILAFSRQADTKRIVLQPTTIIKEAVKMLRPSLPSTIEIRLDIDAQIGSVLADPIQIHQILMNLATNAFHAMEYTGGRLNISLKQTSLDPSDLAKVPGIDAGEFVQLSIGDSGPGIDPEIKDKIFDPYFTTKEPGKGTGMGLSVVHGIVRSNSGVISIESELGKGTTVNVFLPVITMDAAPQKVDREPIPLGSEHILFIDDEQILTRLNKTMLEGLGYKVTVCTESRLALDIFQDRPNDFDLIITDQTMPEMTGVDLSAQMLQIRPDVPIILCTGYSSIVSEKTAETIGIKAFANKPLAKKDIARLIRNVLDSGQKI